VLPSIVHAALELTVLLRGQPTVFELVLVVDLASCDRLVTARGVLAVPIAHLDRSAQRSREESGVRADVDDATRAFEHDPFDVGIGQEVTQLRWMHHRAVFQLAHRAGKGLVAHKHGEERPRLATAFRSRSRQAQRRRMMRARLAHLLRCCLCR